MTATVSIATNSADARALDAIHEHHAELLGALSAQVSRVVHAATHQDHVATMTARNELTRWCGQELVPHAAAEEETLYPAAGRLTAGQLLVAAMTREHAAIRRLVADIAAADEPVIAAAQAVALRVVFENHMTTENEQILPLLAGDPGVSLAELLERMHSSVAGAEAHRDTVEASEEHGHTCGCGEEDQDMPELDARVVPHAIRHATIFGALDAVRPGQGMVLVAPHDPLPLLQQVEQRDPGAFTIEYLESGPETWRLQFLRTA